jgi:hypothetical protein
VLFCNLPKSRFLVNRFSWKSGEGRRARVVRLAVDEEEQLE